MNRWHLPTLGRLLLGMTFCALLFPAAAVQAQTGNIYPDAKFAWSENAGWLNFRPTHGGVAVYDDHLEGYAWAENIGWVRLGSYTGGGAHPYANTSATDYGVNNASGVLSGYAWSENAGWINFSPTHGGVTIDGAGKFDGYGWGENIGWVHFSNAAPEYHVATWGVDTTAPDTSITGQPANPSDNASATFTFYGADNTGGSGVSGYECKLDSDNWSACASPKTYSGLSDGSHTFLVRAKDNAGNMDGSPASYTWVIDTAAPGTSITGQPANPSNSASAAFNFSGDDGTGVGGLTFECDLDGLGFSACTSPKSYTSLADGSHTFQVRASDAARNTDATPASYTWVVDTTAPDTRIDGTNPSATPTNSTSMAFTFSGSDPGGSGVAGFECQIGAEGWSGCTSPQNYSSLSDGSHTFQVRAVDKAGNADATPASYTWKVDTTAPTVVSITSTAGSTTNTSPIPVTITFSEPVCGFHPLAGDLNLTNATASDLTSGSDGSTVYTFDLTPSAQGLVSVYLLAGAVYDGDCVTPLNYNSGNSATFSITYDTDSPTVDSFTATSPSSSLSIPITAFTASDTTGVTGYMITESSTPPAAGDTGWSGTAPATYTVAGTGTYILHPWAKDGAGNVSAVYGSPAAVTVCYSPLTVTNANDNGTGTLRRAIADVCDGGTITFDVALTNQTITLTSGELAVDKGMTIDGGTRQITVSGDNAMRVFHVTPGGNVWITFNMNDLTIANGRADADLNGGGGMWVAGENGRITEVNLSRVTFNNNQSNDAFSEGGGGLRSYNGRLTLTDVAFVNNQAQTGGGMSATKGAGTLTNVTFSGNRALASDYFGCGGLFSGSNLTVTNSTFSGNSGVNGGAFCQLMGGTTFTNVTFQGNGDSSTQSGGAIYNSGSLTITNSILWGNTAADGTQIYNVSSPATVANSVIQGGYADGTNIITTDPLLGPLGAYGGYTQTIPLLPGSSAIDAGNDTTCVSTDQRGVARPQGMACDIGAFESRGFTLAIAGGNNQSAAINTVFANPLRVTVTADNASEPVNGGQVTFTAPASGASAAITGSPVTITGGSASVTAAANGTVGAYIITADTAGANQISFNLQNLAESVPTTTIPETTTTTTTTMPDNDTCALNVFPENFSRLFAVFFPLQIFVVSADNSTSFADPYTLDWETEAIDDLISFRLCSKLIFGFIFVQQSKFVDGDYSVTVGYGSPAKKACAVITLSE